MPPKKVTKTVKKANPKKVVKKTTNKSKKTTEPSAVIAENIRKKEETIQDKKSTKDPITKEPLEPYDEKVLKSDINKDYIPVAFKLPQLNKKDDITDTNVISAPSKDGLTKTIFSTNIDYPKFSLGFHHYIHQSKDKMEIVEDFQGKKRVYLVMNRFERYIDDYDESIGNVSKEYFSKLGNQPNILSRAFYKLWELLFMFDLVPLDQTNFISAHLAEGPGSFIQATMFYRDMFAKKGQSKNDKYHAITLHPEDIKKHIPPLAESFVKYYSKEKPSRFMQHRTVPKGAAKQSGGKKSNGDITKTGNIKLFQDDMKGKKAHFVTADGGFEWKNENTQEQEAFKLILGEVVTALKIQAKGGNFVLKMFETFTSTSLKIMCILSSFYDNVYAVKPLTSRKSNSEKYMVCLGYKDPANASKKIGELEKLLDEFIKHKNMQLVDIYPDYDIPRDYSTTVTKLNTTIANRQFISINEIVDFIEKQNYRGDEYKERREMQIDAAAHWTNTFLPTTQEFDKKKKDIEKARDNITKFNDNLVTVLASKLS